MSGRNQGQLRIGFVDSIPAIALVAGLLGVAWSLAVAQVGWASFPPDFATALVIAGGSLIFFVAHSSILLRHPLLISERSIQLPVVIWREPQTVPLSEAQAPTITLQYAHGVAVGVTTTAGRIHLFSPIFVGRRGTKRLQAYLRSIHARGLIRLQENEVQMHLQSARLAARTAILPALALAALLASVVELVRRELLSVPLAGNIVALSVVLLYSIVFISLQKRLEIRLRTL